MEHIPFAGLMVLNENSHSSAVVAAPVYVGEFQHAIDPKNRVTIPSRWRRGEAEELVVKASPDNQYLAVYSPEEFRARWKKVEENPLISEPAKAKFKRTFASGAREGVVDKQGRMVLPQELSKLVGIEGEVLLIGCLDEFQVWPPQRWEAVKAEQQKEYENIAGVMGL